MPNPATPCGEKSESEVVPEAPVPEAPVAEEATGSAPQTHNASIDALDDELCAMLDESDGDDGVGDEEQEVVPAETIVPPKAPSRQKLLDVICKDNSSLVAFAGQQNLSIRDAMSKRRRGGSDDRLKKRARSSSGALETDKGRRVELKAKYEFFDSLFAKMNLRDSPRAQFAHNAWFEGCSVVDISELPDDPMAAKASRYGEYYVFGCLVSKHGRRQTNDGAKYAVWTLSNMQTGSANDVARVASGGAPRSSHKLRFTSVICLVFDGAYDAHHMQVEGAAFAFRKPAILPPKASQNAVLGKGGKDGKPNKFPDRMDEWSGVCLRVSKKDDVIPIGVCQDYALCGKNVKDRGECGAWYNRQLSQMCPRHMKERTVKITRSIRMDIAGQECPGASRTDFLSSTAPASVTKPESRSLLSGAARKSAEEQARRNIKPVLKTDQEHEKIVKMRAASAGCPPRALPALEIRQVIAGARSDRTISSAGPRRGLVSVPRLQPRKAGPAPAPQVLRSRKNQQKYDEAVSVLVKLGFRRRPDGSLRSPGHQELQRLGVHVSFDREGRTERVGGRPPSQKLPQRQGPRGTLRPLAPESPGSGDAKLPDSKASSVLAALLEMPSSQSAVVAQEEPVSDKHFESSMDQTDDHSLKHQDTKLFNADAKKPDSNGPVSTLVGEAAPHPTEDREAEIELSDDSESDG